MSRKAFGRRSSPCSTGSKFPDSAKDLSNEHPGNPTENNACLGDRRARRPGPNATPGASCANAEAARRVNPHAFAEVGDWDILVRESTWPMKRPFPLILGLAGAGTVAAIGSDVKDFAEGDVVYTYSYPLYDNGAWAEYMLVPTWYVACAPASLELTRAGAVPIVSLTAHECLTSLQLADFSKPLRCDTPTRRLGSSELETSDHRSRPRERRLGLKLGNSMLRNELAQIVRRGRLSPPAL